MTTPAPFLALWHRAGNSARGMAAVQAARRASLASLADRPLRHGVELDLKWTRDGGRLLLYFHHGPTGREVLDAGAARRAAAAGRALLLPALLDLPEAEALHYLVELKQGHGPPAEALRELRRAFEARGLARRTWFAASSLELLSCAAEVWPGAQRVLFGRPLAGSARVLHAPTTRTWRGLRAFGPAPRLAPGLVDVLCPIGLVHKSPRRHRGLAAAARAREAAYLPGRVTRLSDLQRLARDGHAGAFLYAAPAALG